jgi:predicted HicB family RNase H-like nuclease
MDLQIRKKVYEQLRQFDGSVANVAKKLDFTPNYIREIMTRKEGSKSEFKIIEACLKEIETRRKEQSDELEKIFEFVYSKKK